MGVFKIRIALVTLACAAFSATGIANAQGVGRAVSVQFEVVSKVADKRTKEMSSSIRAALEAEHRFTFNKPAKGQAVLKILLTDAGIGQDIRTKKNGLLAMVDYKWSDEREATSTLAYCPPDDPQLCVKKIVDGALDMIEPAIPKKER